MKIKLDAAGRRFIIPVPIGILVNRLSTCVLCGFIRNNTDFPLMPEQLYTLLKELKKAKKVFAGLTIIDISTHDGQKIIVTF